MKIKLICHCGKEFFRFQSAIKSKKPICSKKCRIVSKETKKKISLGMIGKQDNPNRFKKGNIPWNKGVNGYKGNNKGCKFSKETRKKLSQAHIGINKGEKHPLWKGDDVGYLALHNWVRRELGKPNKCDNLNCIYPRKNKRGILMIAPKRFFWANISGEYKRDLSDWHSLCMGCNKTDGVKIAERFKKVRKIPLTS